MRKTTFWMSGLCSFFLVISMGIQPNAFSKIDADMILNNAGFTSYDHFIAELMLDNSGGEQQDVQVFGILEILGVFYFWPEYSESVSYGTQDILTGQTWVSFLEFDFPNIDNIIPFGPMRFWGAYYISTENFAYDVQDFWLGNEHKWTPTPVSSPGVPTSTPSAPTPTPGLYNAGDLYSVDNVVGNMRYVPSTGSGGFMQGAPPTEVCIDVIEGIQFKHVLTRNIAVMETEITRQMWANLQAVQPDLMDDPSFQDHSPTQSHPLQNLKWSEAVLYANLLSLQNGYNRCFFADEAFTDPTTKDNYLHQVYCNFNANGYRLPTEGEWEYFARAGTTGTFPFAEGNYSTETCDLCEPQILPALEAHCVYCSNEYTISEPVGSKMANQWNLKDTLGNVWEWCWDRGAYDYPTGDQTDYAGPATGYYRVYRGAGFLDLPRHCRPATRSGYYPDTSFTSLGFRLVRTIN